MAKLGFTGIGVSNLKKSSDFYQKILDLEAVSYTHLRAHET